MRNKEFYILFIDHQIGDVPTRFEECVNSIIEKLRLDYFRNKSLRIAEHTLLILTEEIITDRYPGITSWIEDAISVLSEKDPFFISYEKLEVFVFIPDEKRKKQLIEKYDELKYYMPIK